MFDNIDLDRRDREPDGDAKIRRLFQEWTQAVTPLARGRRSFGRPARSPSRNRGGDAGDAGIRAVGFSLKILVMGRRESELGFLRS